MVIRIGRRGLIVGLAHGLGGAVLTSPFVARAQQAARIRHIGVLVPGTEGDAQLGNRIKTFEQSLEKLGWIDGRNLRIEYRWAGTDQQRLRSSAAELVSVNPEVILAPTSLALLPLQRATSNIPIVFVAMYDPVGSGFVTNLARPDGNITGFTLGELTL